MKRKQFGSQVGKFAAILGLSFLVFSTLAVIRGIYGVYAAINGVGAVTQAAIDTVAVPVGVALTYIGLGIGLGFIGLVLAFIALFGCRYRAKWFFWGSLSCLPIGTIFGLIYAVAGNRDVDLLQGEGRFSKADSSL